MKNIDASRSSFDRMAPRDQGVEDGAIGDGRVLGRVTGTGNTQARKRLGPRKLRPVDPLMGGDGREKTYFSRRTGGGGPAQWVPNPRSEYGAGIGILDGSPV